ncbi:MAG: ABC transporter substrate-binding protein, partial [Candidatus Bipolaricaulia bacterium]
MSQRYLAIGLSFLLAFLLVSASAVAQDLKVVGAPEISEPGVSGGRLVIGTIGEGPKTLNDLIAQETSSTNITGLMHAGLIDISPVTAAVEPGLAKSWEISPDNRTITFNLR